MTLPASHALQTNPPPNGSLSLWVKWDPALSSSSSSQHLPLISLRSPVLATANVSGQLVPVRAQLALSFGCHRPLGSVSAQLCIEVVLAKDSSPAIGQVTVAQSLWFSSGWPWRWRDQRWHHIVLLQVGGRCSRNVHDMAVSMTRAAAGCDASHVDHQHVDHQLRHVALRNHPAAVPAVVADVGGGTGPCRVHRIAIDRAPDDLCFPQRGSDVGPGALFIDGQPLALSLHSTTYATLTSVPPVPPVPPAAAAAAVQPSSLTLFNMWLANMPGVELITLGGWYDVADGMRAHHQPGLAFWKLQILRQSEAAGPLPRCMALVGAASDWVTLTRAIAPASFPALQPLQPYLGVRVDAAAVPLLNSTFLMLDIGVTNTGSTDAYVANITRAEPAMALEAGFSRPSGAQATCTAGVDVVKYMAQASQLPDPIRPWDCTAWSAPVTGMRLFCLERYEQDMLAAERQALAELQRQEVGRGAASSAAAMCRGAECWQALAHVLPGQPARECHALMHFIA